VAIGRYRGLGCATGGLGPDLIRGLRGQAAPSLMAALVTAAASCRSPCSDRGPATGAGTAGDRDPGRPGHHDAVHARHRPALYARFQSMADEVSDEDLGITA
jgi:hypothetical protein